MALDGVGFNRPICAVSKWTWEFAAAAWLCRWTLTRQETSRTKVSAQADFLISKCKLDFARFEDTTVEMIRIYRINDEFIVNLYKKFESDEIWI